MTRLTALHTRARMDKVRDAAAARLLDWETVAATIGERAGQGHGLALFRPPVGVSIKTTAAASELIDKLTVAGFRCDWRDRRDPDDVPNYDLAVSWDGAPLGG